MTRASVRDLTAMLRNPAVASRNRELEAGDEPGRNKFGAVKTPAPDGAGGLRLYDSKAGAELAHSLEAQRRAGEIESYFVEVSIPLGADENGRQVRYRADAIKVIETYPDGSFRGRFLEKKHRGYDTPNSRTKRAALRARGLNIEVV